MYTQRGFDEYVSNYFVDIFLSLNHVKLNLLKVIVTVSLSIFSQTLLSKSPQSTKFVYFGFNVFSRYKVTMQLPSSFEESKLALFEI